MKEPNSPCGLCYRCEHRARFMETGRGPRYECVRVGVTLASCYMYQPVKPVTLAPNRGERRPLGIGWALAGRASVAKRQAELELDSVTQGRQLTAYWRPKR